MVVGGGGDDGWVCVMVVARLMAVVVVGVDGWVCVMVGADSCGSGMAVKRRPMVLQKNRRRMAMGQRGRESNLGLLWFCLNQAKTTPFYGK